MKGNLSRAWIWEVRGCINNKKDCDFLRFLEEKDHFDLQQS